MTKEQKSHATVSLKRSRDILKRVLSGQEVHAGLWASCDLLGHNLGNDVTVINGREFKVICSLCGH